MSLVLRMSSVSALRSLWATMNGCWRREWAEGRSQACFLRQASMKSLNWSVHWTGGGWGGVLVVVADSSVVAIGAGGVSLGESFWAMW